MNIAELRLIAKQRGYKHVEAFCLMWYQCRSCKSMIRIWNSRDGVTPFGSHCPSCEGTMHHIMTNEGRYSDWPAPDHQLIPCQYFWRDATREDYEWLYRELVPTRGQAYVNKLIEGLLMQKQPWLDCHLPWIKREKSLDYGAMAAGMSRISSGED